MKLEWLTPGRLEQLGLGLETGEEAQGQGAEAGISAEERRLRSELAREAFGGHPEAGREWASEYLRLRDSGWPWRVAAYIAWASSPKRSRWPETLEELAVEVLGLTGPRVIYKWRSKNPAIDEVVGMMQAAPLLEHRADVYRALVASASQVDHRSNPDRKLYLELIGDYTPHSKVEISAGEVDDLSQLSEEELDKLGRDVLKRDAKE